MRDTARTLELDWQVGLESVWVVQATFNRLQDQPIVLIHGGFEVRSMIEPQNRVKVGGLNSTLEDDNLVVLIPLGIGVPTVVF